MISPDYVRLMAAYTRWQNNSVFDAAGELTDEERRRDRGAFFASIHATLNHLLWGDQLWLHRLSGSPAPAATSIAESTQQYASWEELREARAATDRILEEWAGKLKAQELEGELGWYSAAMQRDIRRPKWALVVQLLNHGTHHRGQVNAMLTAAGAKPTDTDVPFIPAEYFAWT